jgi:hypothetical protein
LPVASTEPAEARLAAADVREAQHLADRPGHRLKINIPAPTIEIQGFTLPLTIEIQLFPFVDFHSSNRVHRRGFMLRGYFRDTA